MFDFAVTHPELGRLVRWHQLERSGVMNQQRETTASNKRKVGAVAAAQQQGGSELDVLGELGGGQVVGMEVNASAALTGSDTRHLVGLRERLGDNLPAGILFHTSPRAFALAERVTAAPNSVLWASS